MVKLKSNLKKVTENFWNNNKNNAGITLMVVVIIIVVVLILVGVGIVVFVKSDTVSTEAETSKGQIQEELTKEQEKSSGVQYTAEQLTTENYGDYVVNYPIDIDGDGDYRDDWRIFYIEDYEGEEEAKDGNQPATGKRIFLIASDYVKVQEGSSGQVDENTPIQKSIKKASMESSTVSEESDYTLSWESLPEYHCILPNEVREDGKTACAFPKLFEFSKYNIKDNAEITHQYENSICASSLLCTENWSDFKKDTYAEYATGGASIEMWQNSWNKKYPNNQVAFEVRNDKRGYSIQKNISGIGEEDTLYFPHKTDSGDFDGDGKEETCKGYWLASPYYYSAVDVLGVKWDKGMGAYMRTFSLCGVRPIICLKSDVKFVKSSDKIGDGDVQC